jgi:hypothetical protein
MSANVFGQPEGSAARVEQRARRNPAPGGSDYFNDGGQELSKAVVVA